MLANRKIKPRIFYYVEKIKVVNGVSDFELSYCLMEKHKSSAFVINVIANHCNDAPGLLQTWLAAATFDREQMI